MNGFDVRSIGWVVTRDACAEFARTSLGAPNRMTPDVLRSLGDHWLAVRGCLREEARVPRGNAFQPFATAISPKGEVAVHEFVLDLVSCCPQRYSEPVLHSRCASTAAQALFGFLGCALAGSFATPERMYLGDAAIVLLVMAFCLAISTIQLWRTYRIVKRLNRIGAPQARPPGSMSIDRRFPEP